MKSIFLKALEMGWRGKKKKGQTEVDRKQLIDTAMKMLKAWGDETITEEDINGVIDKVWGEENEEESG